MLLGSIVCYMTWGYFLCISCFCALYFDTLDWGLAVPAAIWPLTEIFQQGSMAALGWHAWTTRVEGEGEWSCGRPNAMASLSILQAEWQAGANWLNSYVEVVIRGPKDQSKHHPGCPGCWDGHSSRIFIMLSLNPCLTSILEYFTNNQNTTSIAISNLSVTLFLALNSLEHAKTVGNCTGFTVELCNFIPNLLHLQLSIQ